MVDVMETENELPVVEIDTLEFHNQSADDVLRFRQRAEQRITIRKKKKRDKTIRSNKAANRQQKAK